MAKLILNADGPEMRLARERAGLTVGQLVERLAQQGVERHPDTIRNCELGNYQPSLEVLDAYARVVGVERVALLKDEPEAKSA
jgi:DNA-binding XRE family transcriptional regulator